MGHQLGHEMLRVGSQKPLRIPRDVRPPADRRAAMNQRDRADTVTWHAGIRGKDCNRVVGRREGDKRVRCGALQEHTRPDMRHVARDVEPLARSEPALRQQQRLVFKFGDLDSTKPAGSVKIRVETITHYLEKYAAGIIEKKKAAMGPGCPLPSPAPA